MSKKLPRGIRNNNPGNIRKSKDKWQGLAKEQPDKAFFTFTNPTYGIRAIARILIKYQDDYKLNTVQKIIDRWAPPIENNTKAYQERVARDMGVDVKDKIDVHQFKYLYPLVEAIIEHENGYNPYTEAQITKGLVLAGVEPEKKPITKSRTVASGVAAGGLTTVSMVSEHIESIAPAFSFVNTVAEYAPYAVGIVVIVLLCYIIWARIDDRRKGLR